jgi:hypothetical protein
MHICEKKVRGARSAMPHLDTCRLFVPSVSVNQRLRGASKISGARRLAVEFQHTSFELEINHHNAQS